MIEKVARRILDTICEKFCLEHMEITFADVQRDLVLIKCITQKHAFIQELLKNNCFAQVNAIRYAINLKMLDWVKKEKIVEREIKTTLENSGVIYIEADIDSKEQEMLWVMELKDYISDGHGRGQEEDKFTRDFSRHLKTGELGGAKWCKASVFKEQKVVYVAKVLSKYRRIKSEVCDESEFRISLENDFLDYFDKVYGRNSRVAVRYILEDDVLYMVREFN